MGGSSSTSKSGSAQKWAQPFAVSGANNVQNVVGAAQPGLQDITSSVQGTIPSILAKYQAGDPALNASENYTTSTLAKDPYAGSPQLDNLVNSTNQDVTDQVGASYGSRGSYGGTAWETALAKGLSGNEDNLRYTDANNTMQQQEAASANAPQQAAAQYLGITPYLAAATTGASLPYTGINAQATDLSSLFGGTTQKTSTSLLGNLIGAAGAVGQGAASAGAFSDRRLKDNIERVGELADGLGVYRWNYVWDAPEARHEGVMADEVAELRPWALGPEIGGYATVNYGAL